MAINRGGRRADDHIDDENYERRGDVNDRAPVAHYNRDNRTGIWSLILSLLLLALIGWLVWWYFNQKQEPAVNNTGASFQDEVRVNGVADKFPTHGATYPYAPANIIIATDSLKLNDSSTIEINKDNQDYSEDKAEIESSGRVLRRDMNEDAPNGIYTVNYKLCAQGQNCETGNFQFKINTELQRTYDNRTNQGTVEIAIENGKFNPEKFIISQGTKVTWRNKTSNAYRLYPGNDSVKKYFPTLNSGLIQSNGSFTFNITEQGYIEYFAQDGSKISGKLIVK